MPEVEIYKLKKTIDSEVREHGMFELRDGPLPQNYVRVWSGELNSTSLETLCGKFMLNPPDGYHDGELKKSDIAVVDGKAYFLDRESGYKFVEVDFDTSGIKDAIHAEYGRSVSVDEAVSIPRKLAAVCDRLNIPIGYVGEPGYHGSSKGVSNFEPFSNSEAGPYYLHPHFLKGEEAQAFAGLLTELSQTALWGEIEGYLRENYPIYMKDLETARERFAPELLLPVELRSLSTFIPIGADKSEVDYLAAKVRGLDAEQRKVFNAITGAGLYCGSVAEIINVTENLDCFKLFPIQDAAQYGDYKLEKAWSEGEAVFHRLENSEDPAERAFAVHITMLEQCVDEEEFGRHIAKQEGGVFTPQGVVTKEHSLKGIYRGVQDLPAEYRVSVLESESKDKESLIMVQNVDLAELLLEIHAVGGEYMRDVKHNLQTLANGGTDFLVMMNAKMLIVTPADIAFRKDTSEHELWKSMGNSPDDHTFILSVTDRGEARVTGNLYEVALEAIQHYLRDFNISFSHLDAEMKDGSKRNISLKEWNAMHRLDRDKLKSWVKHYDPADESRLEKYLDVLRWAVGENRQEVSADQFLSKINMVYMAQANHPQPDMFRVTREAAQEMLARGDADVYRLLSAGAEKLSPIDAVKSGGLWYSVDREFAIRQEDTAALRKWTRRTSGDMLRQMERGEPKKSHKPEI